MDPATEIIESPTTMPQSIDENTSDGVQSRNVYCASLPHSFTDEDLLALTRPFGHVISARAVPSKKSGRCKGYGFVLFETATSAARCIEELHGARVGGHRIQVRQAREEATVEEKIMSRRGVSEEDAEALLAAGGGGGGGGSSSTGYFGGGAMHHHGGQFFHGGRNNSGGPRHSISAPMTPPGAITTIAGNPFGAVHFAPQHTPFGSPQAMNFVPQQPPHHAFGMPTMVSYGPTTTVLHHPQQPAAGFAHHPGHIAIAAGHPHAPPPNTQYVVFVNAPPPGTGGPGPIMLPPGAAPPPGMVMLHHVPPPPPPHPQQQQQQQLQQHAGFAAPSGPGSQQQQHQPSPPQVQQSQHHQQVLPYFDAQQRASN